MGTSAVLVHLHTNRIYELNETGARVWELLAEGQTVEAITARLGSEFDTGDEPVADAVNRIVGDLTAEGLLEPGV